MKLTPMADRVLLKPTEAEETTAVRHHPLHRQ